MEPADARDRNRKGVHVTDGEDRSADKAAQCKFVHGRREIGPLRRFVHAVVLDLFEAQRPGFFRLPILTLFMDVQRVRPRHQCGYNLQCAVRIPALVAHDIPGRIANDNVSLM